MKPILAIVGRPNVGKSTLFNRLTRSRDALVADIPGLTRDRQYGAGILGEKPFTVIDTGGLGEESEAVDNLMAEQAQKAIVTADVIAFVVDARVGLTSSDELIARELRKTDKPVHIVINKIDGLNPELATTDFYALGFDHIHTVAASHGRGCTQLIENCLASFPVVPLAEDNYPGVHLAIVGRPNVGKSTLVNRMLGEERVVVCDLPGTTRDSIFIPLKRFDDDYVLIDTAGVRRRGRVREVVEKFSIVKTLDAIERAKVVVCVMDAHEGVTEQDLHLIGYVLDAGRSLVIAVNKWDGLDAEIRENIRNELTRRLDFVKFADILFISALHGSNVGHIFEAVQRAYQSARQDLQTAELTQLLESATKTHQPPLIRGRRIKLRYAHPGAKFPPTIIIHGNQTARLPGAYKRYLENYFREHLKIVGTPIRLIFKTGENPFANKRNKLTPRQERTQRARVRKGKR